jgi:hypothetical protein
MSRLTGSSSSSSGSSSGAGAGASAAANSSDVHLLLQTDAVSEGMLLAKVEADRGGFTEEIDTSRMTATEARTALRPLQVSTLNVFTTAAQRSQCLAVVVLRARVLSGSSGLGLLSQLLQLELLAAAV